MQWLKTVCVGLALSEAALCAQQIPPGTALPVMLSSALDAKKDKPGREILARVMQEVRLPDGASIPAGARVVGHILQVSSPTATSGSRLVVNFDQLISRGQTLSLTTNLRAIASMTEVFDAQLPTSTFDDYGTSIADWTTVQVGGDAVYRRDGKVISWDNQVVGSATLGGSVTAKLLAVPDRGCRGPIDGNDGQQALWVFSTSACGAYGFSELKLAHAGRTNPVGEIVLESPANLRVRSGSGLLLRVIAPAAVSANAR